MLFGGRSALEGMRLVCTKLLCVSTTLLVISGCSHLSFIYSFAESALKEETAFFLHLDDDEERLVYRKIDELLAWHRAEMLPRYAFFMNAQADLVAGDNIDGTAVVRAVRIMRALLDDLVQGAAPYVAEVLVNHTSQEKLSHLDVRMAERLEERREALNEPAEERLKVRAERIITNFERLTGDLTDDQTDRIHRYAAQTAGADLVWFRTRKNRQRALLNFLSREPDQNQIRAFAIKIVLRGYEIVDPEYKAISEERWRSFTTLLADIIVSLSPEQRATMTKTLRVYAIEVLALAE